MWWRGSYQERTELKRILSILYRLVAELGEWVRDVNFILFKFNYLSSYSNLLFSMLTLSSIARTNRSRSYCFNAISQATRQLLVPPSRMWGWVEVVGRFGALQYARAQPWKNFVANSFSEQHTNSIQLLETIVVVFVIEKCFCTIGHECNHWSR